MTKVTKELEKLQSQRLLLEVQENKLNKKLVESGYCPECKKKYPQSKLKKNYVGDDFSAEFDVYCPKGHHIAYIDE